MSACFSWDPEKAASNVAKHGVTFKDASIVFDDPGIHIELQRHANEIRLSARGYSSNDRLLVVVFAEVINDKEIRIISARKANRADRKKYEQERET